MQTTFANPRRLSSLFALSLAVLSFLQFLIYYLAYGSFDTPVAILMTASYSVNFLEGLFPPLAALALFITRGHGIKNKLLPASLIIFTKLFYTLPYYYIYFVSDVFNSLEAILYSFLVSIIYLIYTLLQTLVCIFLFNYAESKVEADKRKREYAKLFDIDDHVNFGILLSVMIPFIIFFVRALIDTVTYIIDVSGNFRNEEILTIVLTFAVVIFSAALQYTLCAVIKNLLFKYASLHKSKEAE